jgi:hypothetical protein
MLIPINTCLSPWAKAIAGIKSVIKSIDSFFIFKHLKHFSHLSESGFTKLKDEQDFL